MSPVVVVIAALVVYFLGYKFYSGFLARKVFQLRKDVLTPAHRYKDGVDFLPTPPYILFGHHFASIAGLGPILGPAVAVIYGWLPALLWVVFGTIFIGAVHDFSAMVLSVRAKGLSIGSLTENLIGRRAKLLFLLIIFFLVALAMGVFVFVLGILFSAKSGYPQVVTPSIVIMVLAMLMGYLSFKKGLPMRYLGLGAFLIVVVAAAFSSVPAARDLINLEQTPWKFIMLGYAFLASVLPIWLLLQSRDYLNSLLLYLGMGLLYLGFFVSWPTEFATPTAIIPNPEGAAPLFPFVFVIIACGAVSGFHALVSSGTSSKQLNKETDARPIGYGAMVGESLLGLMAILATTTLVSGQDWLNKYGGSGSWKVGDKVNVFIEGGTRFLTALAIPAEMATGLIAFIVVSFALTSLDSATRLLRYNVEELAGFVGVEKVRTFLQNRFVSSLLAVASIGFFAFFTIGGKAAGLALWQLFGTTNQLLAALALLVASIYLYSRGKNPLYTLIPMLFVLVSTITAMFQKLMQFFAAKPSSPLLITMAIALIVMTAWLLVESILAALRYRKNKIVELDIISD